MITDKTGQFYGSYLKCSSRCLLDYETPGPTQKSEIERINIHFSNELDRQLLKQTKTKQTRFSKYIRSSKLILKKINRIQIILFFICWSF